MSQAFGAIIRLVISTYSVQKRQPCPLEATLDECVCHRCHTKILGLHLELPNACAACTVGQRCHPDELLRIVTWTHGPINAMNAIRNV